MVTAEGQRIGEEFTNNDRAGSDKPGEMLGEMTRCLRIAEGLAVGRWIGFSLCDFRGQSWV